MKHTRTVLILSAWLVTLDAAALTASIGTVKPETCGNANGELAAYLTGGGTVYQPLSYLWSNGGTTQTITGLAAGSYSVTITDAQGTPFTANGTLDNVTALPIQDNQSPSYTSFFDLLGYTGAPCEGQCNGTISMPMVQLGGTPPFTAVFSVANTYLGVDNAGFPYYTGFCGQDPVNYTLTDAFGCQGTGSFYVYLIDASLAPTVTDVQGACTGADIGSFLVHQDFDQSRVQLYDFNGIPVGMELLLDEFSTHVYQDLPSGSYTLYTYPKLGQCLIPVPVTIPDLGPGCTEVEGNAWFDLDADCVWDGGEVRVEGSVMVIEPGTQYAITGPSGHYNFNLPAGNYTIAQTNPTLVPYCPATQPVPFTVNGPIANIDWANNSTAPLDLRAHINGGWARPGFPHTIHGAAVNSTVQATGAVEVIITIDPTVVIGNVTPTPTTTAGNVFTWQIAELDYFGTQGFNIQTTVPVSTPLGTVLNHSIIVSSVNADADLSDNTELATEVVFGSYDPNDKTAVTSSHESEALYFINEDEWIDYTIRFQNTGTAEALFVTITDTLPQELDMTTFQMALASHPHTYTFTPGRVVEWFFNNINLPDSTSDEQGSHGFVKFRIRPAQPLLPGTLIENTANIYFDFNDPVITEPSVLTAEFTTGVVEEGEEHVSIWPVPSHDVMNISARSSIAHVLVLAADGRVVMRSVLQGTSGSIDLSGSPPGAYLLVATLANGHVLREAFIIQ